jgi:hypothetical protein
VSGDQATTSDNVLNVVQLNCRAATKLRVSSRR